MEPGLEPIYLSVVTSFKSVLGVYIILPRHMHISDDHSSLRANALSRRSLQYAQFLDLLRRETKSNFLNYSP